MTDDPTPDPDTTLARLLALGVPYHLAVEAMASTALDRDEDDGGAHTRHWTDAERTAWAESEDRTVQPGAVVKRGWTAGEGKVPEWLHDDPDGYRIVDRD